MSYKKDRIAGIMIDLRRTMSALIAQSSLDDETKTNVQNSMINSFLDLGAMIDDGTVADMVLEDIHAEIAAITEATTEAPVEPGPAD